MQVTKDFSVGKKAPPSILQANDAATKIETQLGEIISGKCKPGNMSVEDIVTLIAFARSQRSDPVPVITDNDPRLPVPKTVDALGKAKREDARAEVYSVLDELNINFHRLYTANNKGGYRVKVYCATASKRKLRDFKEIMESFDCVKSVKIKYVEEYTKMPGAPLTYAPDRYNHITILFNVGSPL